MLRFLSTSLLFVFYVAALGTNTAWGAPKPISGCTRITARGPYVFTNSRFRTPPGSATGIRADAQAYTLARDGGLREKACSRAFPGQPARAEPSRLCESS